MNQYQTFKALHAQKTPLHIANVWDVKSALLFEKLGYQAIGTSSSAIAESLGYEDSEHMSFDELLSVVKHIKQKTTLPFTVDLEAGYSRDPQEIVKNIISLIDLGVVGINIEDSIVTDGVRKIVDAEAFSTTLLMIKSALTKQQADIFINVRTDPFLLGLDDALNQTIKRAVSYTQAGADGIFVPCVTNENDIKTIVNTTHLPVNVMAMADLPSFDVLAKLGVKRISMGPFFYLTLNNKINELFNQTVEQINQNQSFDMLFEK